MSIPSRLAAIVVPPGLASFALTLLTMSLALTYLVLRRKSSRCIPDSVTDNPAALLFAAWLRTLPLTTRSLRLLLMLALLPALL